jgi:MarR family transcriptional regulator, organic hydroperoxide resistance regulator
MVTATITSRDYVAQILDELDPFIAIQRKAVAKAGCLRAISSTQLHVLFVLVGEGAMPMSHLADGLGVSLPNVTGIIDRMVEHGYVERGRDEGDRRVVTVAATTAGRAAVDEIDMVRRKALIKVLERLTPDQQRRALEIFTELRTAAEAADEAERSDQHISN